MEKMLVYELVDQVVAFIELCQSFLENGEIDIDEYWNLTKLKFEFINDLAGKDLCNKKLEAKIYNIISSNSALKQIVI